MTAAPEPARLGSRLAPLTVRQLNERADTALVDGVGPLWVQGEVSRFVAHGSGHWYFTLVDGEAAVDCAMFRNRNQSVRFRLSDGLAVLVFASPRVYVQRGRMQLVVEVVDPAGLGAAALALEQLKQKLAAEGLFDAARKRPLPTLPRRIGVATSLDGAALRDVLHVLRRRFAGVSVLVAPTAVQGAEAPDEIARAIAALDGRGLEVLLVVRGGGSREDLAAFDDERVVRAIAACGTPVVTGIGHEIDTSLADLAADLRAPTPSAAAELVVRERDELAARVASLRAAIAGAVRRRLDRVRSRVLAAHAARGFREPARRLGRARLQLADAQRRLESSVVGRLRTLIERLRQLQRRLAPQSRRAALAEFRGRRNVLAGRAGAAMNVIIARLRARLAENSRRLDALSPLAVLSRGYALVQRDGPAGLLVRSADDLRAGDDLFIRLGSGAAEARVTAIRPDKRSGEP